MQYSIVKYLSLNKPDVRIDAEYYRPYFLKIEKKVNSIKSKPLHELSIVITDFGAYSQNNIVEYIKGGHATFVRNQDIKGFIIDYNNRLTISCDVYKQLSLHLAHDDILVQRVGSLGKASIVMSKDLPATANQNLALIRINSKAINPYYVLTFLNSKYGKAYFERLKTGNVQPWLNLGHLKGINVPILTNGFQKKAENIVRMGYDCYEDSKKSFKQAKALLLKELKLHNWFPRHQLSFIKNYTEVNRSKRMDAEHFQPKYDEIELAVKAHHGNWDIIGNQFKVNKSRFNKKKDKAYNYLEIGGVNISNGLIETLRLEASEMPANAKINLKKGDIVVSKVRTYRGAVAIIDREDIIGSGAFIVLQENGKVPKEVLFTLLKTKPYLVYSLKFNVGTSYPTLFGEDILNYPIPIFSDTINSIIKDKVNKSFVLRSKSRDLLDIAKNGVELAIEEDERTSEAWMRAEVSKLGIEL